MEHDPEKRISIEDLEKHPFLTNKPILSGLPLLCLEDEPHECDLDKYVVDEKFEKMVLNGEEVKIPENE